MEMIMQLIVSTFHCSKQLHDTEFASSCTFHTLSSDCWIQDTLSGELSPGKTMSTLLAKTFFHSLFSLGWVELVSSSQTKQSALCCCSLTKGDCCLSEAIWVTHQFMSIQVCPSWRSCQGDWGQSQMGSLTHKPRGRKHFGMWVVVFWTLEASDFQLASHVMVEYWLWVAGLSSSPTISERQNPRGWLTASPHRFVFSKLAQPEILLANLLNVQKASSCQHASLNLVSLPADATWSTSGMTVQRSRTRRQWTSPPSWSACLWSCAAACSYSSTFSMTAWVRRTHIPDVNTHDVTLGAAFYQRYSDTS